MNLFFGIPGKYLCFIPGIHEVLVSPYPLSNRPRKFNRFWPSSLNGIQSLNSCHINHQPDEIRKSDIERQQNHGIVHMEEIRKCPDPFIVQKICIQH